MSNTETRAATIGEIVASMPAWVYFLSLGESEAVQPVGVKFSAGGISVELRKVLAVTDSGKPEEIGRRVVSEADIEKAVRWRTTAFNQLLDFSAEDRTPFVAVMDKIEEIDEFVNVGISNFLAEGTVSVSDIRRVGNGFPLLDLVRASGEGADRRTDTVVISGDRFIGVQYLDRDRRDLPTPASLVSNIQVIDQVLQEFVAAGRE
ncbi:MAG TPA: hypothetical protein VMR77_01270 [Patescibacteria group bacterium]|jgi:hypothetical protein|nr:hypothetical protein [Patescibacteria group bacterium]